MDTPIYLASSGHVCQFTEPDRANLTLFSPYSEIIKFQAIMSKPYLNTLRSGENFTVFGSLFSLLFETARALNYTLSGLAVLENATEATIWKDFFTFQPDVVLLTLSPELESILEALDVGLIRISDMVATHENDHILSAKKYKADNIFSIVAPFDLTSLLFGVTGLFCFSMLAEYLKVKPTMTTLTDFIWNMFTALIVCPQIMSEKTRWRLFGLTWSIGVFLLQQLFSGDMFTAMTLPPDLDVIDNFADLALRTAGSITVFDGEDADVKDYLSPYREHREELTNRITILPVAEQLNSFFIREVLENVSTSLQYHLDTSAILDIYQNVYFKGFYKEKIHISKEFGQLMPTFLAFGLNAEYKIEKALNVM